MSGLIIRDDTGNGTCALTLNSEANRNALSSQMLETLLFEIQRASDDSHVRVIVIGAKGSTFCAGHDLREIESHRDDSDYGAQFFTALMELCAETMQAIVTAPKPVIAKVDGIATAAGCQLVASCDLAYASERSKFCTPGVHIGLFCSTPMVALSRNVATKHALEMLLVGDLVPADDAQSIGLINRSVSVSKLDQVIEGVAGKIASKSGHTLKIGKHAFYEQKTMSLEDAYAYASEVMVANLLAQDSCEGINAFLEKRTPNWSQA